MLGIVEHEHDNALLPSLFLSNRNDHLIFTIINDIRALA